jgi:hypothetical protein
VAEPAAAADALAGAAEPQAVRPPRLIVARFSVLVRAENLRLPVAAGGRKRIARGFLVWRSVEATSREEAEACAFESVRADPSLADIQWDSGDKTPRLVIEECHEVVNWASPPPGSGYIFV